MKKVLAILAATFAMAGASSAMAAQALMITSNGIVIYDNSRDHMRDIRLYNSAAPLPYGYKRVCNDRYSRFDFRNRDCVVLPPHHVGKRPPPPHIGHRPPPPPPPPHIGHRPPPPGPRR